MTRVALAALAAGAACSILDGLGGKPAGTPDAAPGTCSAPPCREIVGEFPTSAVRDLDLLFVIDTSPDMGDEQDALAGNFTQIVNTLAASQGGLPNLHIGAITSDVGLGSSVMVEGCGFDDDDGRLQAGAGAGCTPPPDPFLVDIDDGAGGRLVNYQGTLEEAFACLARLGTMGCGFEQPLEAVRRALDGRHPENAAFLRGGAYLAVVFLTSEDDCSASDPALFDPARDDLGPWSSFRCTRWGVDCTGDFAVAGTYPGCGAFQASPYLHPPSSYVDFLRQLRPPSLTYLVAIAGPPEPFTIADSGVDDFSLEPSCASSTGEAAPAVRLGAVLDGFTGRSTFSSVCDGDLTAASQAIAGQLGSLLATPCLTGLLLDADPSPGLQPDCKTYLVAGRYGDSEVWTEIPACAAAPGQTPCFDLGANPAECPYSSGNLHLLLDYGAVTPEPGTFVVVTCYRP